MKKIYIILITLLLATPSLAHADILSNLLASYGLNEGFGTSVADSSGNSHTGTFSGSPSWVTGHNSSYALGFNGSSDYVDAGAFADSGTDFTISAWFKTSTVTPTGPCEEAIVSKMNSGGYFYGTGWALFMNPSGGGGPCGSPGTGGEIGGLVQDSGGGNWSGRYTTATYADGSWHHAVMTVAGLSSVVIYIDGDLVNSYYTFANGTVTSITTGTSVKIGINDAGEGFNGNVDDVRIYNRTLSAGDVQELYTQGPSSSLNKFIVSLKKFIIQKGTRFTIN